MRPASVSLYVLAGVCAIATALGLVIGPDWIETAIGRSPDGGSGTLEVAWIVVPALLAAVATLAGWRSSRVRTRPQVLQTTPD